VEFFGIELPSSRRRGETALDNPRVSAARARPFSLAIHRSTVTCVRYDTYNQEDCAYGIFQRARPRRKLLKLSVRAAFATLSSRRAHPRRAGLKKN